MTTMPPFRTLFVCALCVLWCGVNGMAAETPAKEAAAKEAKEKTGLATGKGRWGTLAQEWILTNATELLALLQQAEENMTRALNIVSGMSSTSVLSSAEDSLNDMRQKMTTMRTSTTILMEKGGKLKTDMERALSKTVAVAELQNFSDEKKIKEFQTAAEEAGKLWEALSGETQVQANKAEAVLDIMLWVRKEADHLEERLKKRYPDVKEWVKKASSVLFDTQQSMGDLVVSAIRTRYDTAAATDAFKEAVKLAEKLAEKPTEKRSEMLAGKLNEKLTEKLAAAEVEEKRDLAELAEKLEEAAKKANGTLTQKLGTKGESLEEKKMRAAMEYLQSVDSTSVISSHFTTSFVSFLFACASTAMLAV